MRPQRARSSAPAAASAVLACLTLSLCTTCASLVLDAPEVDSTGSALIALPTDIRWSRLAEANGVVYAEGSPRGSGGAAASELVAVDVATRQMLWQRAYDQLESELSTACGWPFAQADRLFLVCDDAVVALRPSDGSPVWTTALRWPNLIDADVDRLLFLSEPDRITALDPDNGEVIDEWILGGYRLDDGYRSPVSDRYLLRARFGEQRTWSWLIADLEEGGEWVVEEAVRFSPPSEDRFSPEVPCWDLPADDWTWSVYANHDVLVYPNRSRRRVALPWLSFGRATYGRDGAGGDPDGAWPLRLVAATVDSPEREEWEVTLVDERGACRAGARIEDVDFGDSTVLVTTRLGGRDAPIQQLEVRLLDLRTGQLITGGRFEVEGTPYSGVIEHELRSGAVWIRLIGSEGVLEALWRPGDGWRSRWDPCHVGRESCVLDRLVSSDESVAFELTRDSRHPSGLLIGPPEQLGALPER